MVLHILFLLVLISGITSLAGLMIYCFMQKYFILGLGISPWLFLLAYFIVLTRQEMKTEKYLSQSKGGQSISKLLELIKMIENTQENKK